MTCVHTSDDSGDGHVTLATCSQCTVFMSRAPEVILGVAYDEAIDMWSLGCVLAELFLGWPLFPGATEYDQISYIEQMMGEPPPSLTKNLVKMCKFYRRDNRMKWILKVYCSTSLIATPSLYVCRLQLSINWKLGFAQRNQESSSSHP